MRYLCPTLPHPRRHSSHAGGRGRGARRWRRIDELSSPPSNPLMYPSPPRSQQVPWVRVRQSVFLLGTVAFAAVVIGQVLTAWVIAFVGSGQDFGSYWIAASRTADGGT